MPEPVKKTRATLPGAAELFRSTEPKPAPEPKPVKADTEPVKPTGRVRHNEKITVYFSSEELFALEDARTELRRNLRINVDRGRIVRTAVALALQDLAEHGQDSALAQQLAE